MGRRCKIILACFISLLGLTQANADDNLPPIVPAGTPWLGPADSAPMVGPDLSRSQPSSSVYMSLGTRGLQARSSTPQPVPAARSVESIADHALAPLGTSPYSYGASPYSAVDPVPATGSVSASGSNSLAGSMPSGLVDIAGGLSSPFSADKMIEPPEINQKYDRVLDLFPDNNDRELIQRVRKAVQQTEVGIDVTDEEWITVRGGGKRVTWGGRIETDMVNWARGDEFSGESNYVEFRRLRLMASGEGYGIYDYQLELEFSPELNDNRIGDAATQNFGVEIKDAYIGIREVPILGYTVIGHFRTPIGLSSLTSTRFLPFMERSLPNRLMPGRELGIAAFNRSSELNMAWGYGFFFDDLDEAKRSIVNDNQGTRFISRMTWTPYYDEASNGACLLHTGVGYAYTRPRLRDDPNGILPSARAVRFTGRPEIHRGDPLITTGVIDTQQFQIFNAELAWANGPVTVQSEATYVDLDQADGSSTQVWGAYLHGSWFLTGERRPYDRNYGVFRRVAPYENFWLVRTPDGTQAGLGAWELAARWSHLNFSDVTDQYLSDVTVGLNWYWNPHSRLMFNWIRPLARNSPVGNYVDSEGDIIAARMQIDF